MKPTIRNCAQSVCDFSANHSLSFSVVRNSILLFFVLMINLLGSFTQAQVSPVSFNSIPFSDPDLVAPFRGAERWHSSTNAQMINNPTEANMAIPMDIYHRSSLSWDELESAQGVYTWGYFDQVFNNAILNKQKISFGIMTQNPGRRDGPSAGGANMSYPLYVHNLMQAEASNSRDWISVEDPFWIPNYNSPNYLARFEALLNAIAQHINTTSFNGVSYRDALGYVDIRGYGSWGEWHMVAAASSINAYPAGRRPLASSLIRIIDAHIKAFPNHPLVSIISTFDGNQFGNTMVPPEVGYHALTATNTWGKIGWRRDNWGWIDGYISDWLERNQTVYNGMRFDTAIMNRWRYAPILGEGPCGGTNNGGPCAFWDIPRQVKLYHASMIGNGNFCGENGNGVRGRDSMRMAWKLSGYRIVLEGGNISSSISAGAPLSISLNWKNIGVAPVYENWNVTYELQNQSSGAIVWTGQSSHRLRSWIPQSAATVVTDNYTLPSNLPAGTYRLVLKVKDPTNYRTPLPLAIQGRRADGGYQLRQDITLSGGGPNAAPTANAGSDQVISLPTNSVTLSGTGTDADGSISAFSWNKVSGPNGGVIQTAAAAVTLITGLVSGIYVYRLTVTDNNGATATDEVQITVNNPSPPPNSPPFANAGNDQTVTLPANTTTLNGSATDSNGTIASYAWTKISGPAGGNLQSANTASTNVTGLNAGTYVFRLTVTDNAGAIATDDVQVIVNASIAPSPANQAPTANAGTDINITLPANSATLTGAGTDADGSVTAFAWSKVSGPTGGNIQNANTASTNITGLTTGTYIFRLTVTDNVGAEATDDVQLIVTAAPPAPVNQAPTANAGSDQSVTLPANTVTLSGSGNDSDGTIASYTWSKLSGPAGGNLQSANTASTNVTGLNAGTYVFRLTVTDNSGAIATDDIQVIVNTSLAPSPSNQAPTANAGNDINITLPTNSATLTGVGNDADGSVSSYAWSKISGPTGGNIQNANTASTNITGLTSGTYIFRLTVTDNAGAEATDDVQVIVTAAPPVAGNQPPTANAGSNQSITLPVNSVTLSGSGNDADGSITTFAWTKISGPTGGNLQAPSAASTVISGLVEGTYTYRLTVIDNAGATATGDVQVIVNAAPVLPNTAPTANAGHDVSITLPTNSVTLNGTASVDPDGSIVSYGWRKIQGPAGSSFTSTNIASPAVVGLARGQHEFELTITDNRGATSTDRVLVTVIKVNQKPVAKLNRDTINVVMPVQNTELSASDSYDPDGLITGYDWTFKSGPREPKILSPQSSKTIVADLVTGTYEFDLHVMDDDGEKDKKAVVVIVKNNSNRRLIPDVSIYPNPATNLVNIKISSDVEGRTTLTFIDMNGRPVMTDVFVKVYGSYTRQVNIGRLPKGTYSVLVQVDQTEKVVEKFIKF